jgi:hypothetical protein
LHNTIEDPEGRFVILDCTINNQKVSLVNIYGPNDDDYKLFDLVRTKLQQFENNSMIMGGDFNVVQNYVLDTLSITNRNNQKYQEAVNNLKKELDLIDPLREADLTIF